MSDIIKKELQRNGYCRGCDCVIERGTEVVYTSTSRAKGATIFFCDNCVDDIVQLRMDDFKSPDDFGQHLVMNKLQAGL